MPHRIFIESYSESLHRSPRQTREWYIKKFEPPEKNLSGKTVVISGATSGIGLKTAEEFAKLRAKVVMLCRDEAKCINIRRKLLNNTKNGQIFCSKIDLESLSSVKQCANRLDEKLDKIDILVNCAGVMRIPKKTLTVDGLEMHMSVNHYSHFVLTNLLLSKMEASEDPRILNITCQDYRKGKLNFDNLNLLQGYTPGGAYQQSKLANVLFTKELAERLKESKVNVYSVRANKCHTDLKRNFSYWEYYSLSAFPRMVHWFFEFSLPHVVETIKYAALEPSLKDKEKSGICINNCKEEKCRLPDDYRVLAKKLWLTSEKWTNLEKLRQADTES